MLLMYPKKCVEVIFVLAEDTLSLVKQDGYGSKNRTLVEELGKEEERALVDNIYLQSMKNRGVRKGGWQVDFEVCQNQQLTGHTLRWLLKQSAACYECAPSETMQIPRFKFQVKQEQL